MNSIVNNILTLINVILLSASSSHYDFGKNLIPKDNDSIATKALFAKIKNIDNDVFDSMSFEGATKINYRFLKPKKVKSNKKYPLVVIFHGSGAIGTDNLKQLQALPKLWAQPEIRDKYPAYVIAIQFPTRSSNYSLDSSRNVLTSKSEPCLETVFQLIDSLKTDFQIDKKRIYAMGYSMGGSTTINALSLRPDLFAAGISFAGIPQFDTIDVLKNKPMWLIHGNKDTENTIDSDVQFYNELGENSKTLFWELDNTDHGSIISSQFLGDAIPKWLLSK
jgi:predicted peptidase